MWDGVPWFVGGGAEHSPDVARLLSYVGFGGEEGIVRSTDLEVRELATPGTEVRVFPGACSILNRATAGFAQAYAGRLPSQDTVGIAATGAGETRSDLVVARVENPHIAGEPWPDPTDPKVGPYIFSRVVAGVDPTTVSLQEVNPGESGIALARIDMPESTATVIQDYITDLRSVLPVLTKPVMDSVQHSGVVESLTPADSVFTDWPTTGQLSVTVPEWATRVDVLVGVLMAVVDGGAGSNIWGQVRPNFGGILGGATWWNFNTATTGGKVNGSVWAGATYDVTTLQGQTVTAKTQARVDGGTGSITADDFVTTTIQLQFRQTPEFNL